MTKYNIGEQLVNSLPLFTSGEPFTIDQIDAHPDAQRIWRTIQEVAGDVERTYNQGYMDGYADCNESWWLEQREG